MTGGNGSSGGGAPPLSEMLRSVRGMLDGGAAPGAEVCVRERPGGGYSLELTVPLAGHSHAPGTSSGACPACRETREAFSRLRAAVTSAVPGIGGVLVIRGRAGSSAPPG